MSPAILDKTHEPEDRAVCAANGCVRCAEKAILSSGEVERWRKALATSVQKLPDENIPPPLVFLLRALLTIQHYKARVERRYDIVAINEKTGYRETLTSSPLFHDEACIMKSKFTEHRDVRIQLEEVIPTKEKP